MNAAVARTAGRYLGLWVAIAVSVGLVSFTFSFLGTITSAVLVGMMMGAFKGAKWFSVLVSLVFPAAIFGLTHNSRAELTPTQVLGLAALCFGTFWTTYIVSAFMFFYEQKDRKSATAAARASPPGPPGQGAASTAAASLITLAELSVSQEWELLQGEWVHDGPGAVESVSKRIIQIKEGRFELKVVDGSGRASVLARGEVSLQRIRPCTPSGD